MEGRQVLYNGNDRLIMILMTGQQINDISNEGSPGWLKR